MSRCLVFLAGTRSMHFYTIASVSPFYKHLHIAILYIADLKKYVEDL